MELTAEQIRVLGCLAEKEATTPDGYPLSTNTLVLACNQRSSRDPVVDYGEDIVNAALIALRERGLVRTSRGEGSRVYKHAHLLRESLGVDRGELAVLSVLMLRGPQTPGELRTRTDRQHAFSSLGQVEGTLERLAAREPSLAVQLPREPGRREARWQHLLGAASTPAAEARPTEPLASAAVPGVDPLAELRSELAELRRRVERLEQLGD
jgi:uncharacterized protein YceH (UPF0502 family)